MATAAAYLVLQSMALVAMTPPPPPVGVPRTRCTVSMTSMSFDETTETITLPLDEEFTADQARSAWNLMVSSARQHVCVVPDDLCEPIQSSCINMARPPAPVLNVKAPAIYHGLFCLPCNRPFGNKCTELESTAFLAMRNFSRDGATANAAVLAHAARTDFPSTCVSDKLCTLHRSKHVKTAIVAAAGFEYLGKLYAMALCLRTAGYYVRLLHVLRTYLEEHVQISKDPRPAGAKEYAELVIQHMIDGLNYDKAQSIHEEKKVPDINKRKSTKLSPEEHWRELPNVITGKWFDDDG